MSRTLAVALAIALLLVPTAAEAQRWTAADATGDTRSFQVDPNDICAANPTTSEAAGGQDITGMTVRHQPGTVVVRLRYAAPATTTDRTFALHLGTPDDRFWVDVYQRREGARWRMDVSGEPSWKQGPFDSDGDGEADCTVWFGVSWGVGCRGYDVDVEDQLVTVGIPRRCLGRPRWVEAGAESWGRSGDVVTGDEWGTSVPSPDPRIMTYGERVWAGAGPSGWPSNRSRVASSSTGTRRSFVISRTGFPIGTTAATAY